MSYVSADEAREIGRGWGVRFVSNQEAVPKLAVPTAEEIVRYGDVGADVEMLAAVLEGRRPAPSFRFAETGRVVLPSGDNGVAAELKLYRPGPNAFREEYEQQPPPPSPRESAMYGPDVYGVMDFKARPVDEIKPAGGVKVTGPDENGVGRVGDDVLGQFGYVSYKVAFAAAPLIAMPDGVYTMELAPQQAYDLAFDEDDEEDPVWTDV